MIVRWDKAGGKDIRPVARRGDGWIIGGMPDPKPLYDLPGLAGAEVVYVVEGEKAADAARSIDLTATTSPHGSKSADKADWTPLAGKSVVILPDNDSAGRSYAEAVAAILAKLTPPAIVKTVDLPDLPVGESGTAKTPAFKLVMRPIRRRQQKALEQFAEAMGVYDQDVLIYEADLSEWKRKGRKRGEPPPEKPDPPRADRCIVSDTTVEALAPLLLDNLLARDELAGWFGSFDRYAGGSGGADAAHWLSMHNAESLVVDRKTGNPRTIYVPQASMCVTGGIQPAILHRALGTEHRESGLAARLLLTCPPRVAKRWTEAGTGHDAEATLALLVDRLYELQPTADEDGEPRPVVAKLTHDAKTAWKKYYYAHAQEQVDLSGDLAAAWSKLEEYAARLALVIHYTRWAADDPTLQDPDIVDAQSIAGGVALVQWFKHEARRVYAMLSESEGDRDQRRLIEWIDRKGGAVTAREAQQGHRRLATAGDAEAALEELTKAGLGTWQNSSPGQRGKPTRRFVLSTVSTSTIMP